MIRSADLPLLLASSAARSGADRYPLDRIRMQKAVFLLAQRGPQDWRSLYQYEPYNWGPYSGALTNDVESLERSRDLEVQPVRGARYGSYATTATGDRRASEIWQTLDPRLQDFLRSVRSYVTSRSFSELLREVYAAYPDYASKSLFNGR